MRGVKDGGKRGKGGRRNRGGTREVEVVGSGGWGWSQMFKRS